MKQTIINYLKKEQQHTKKLNEYFQEQINKVNNTNNKEEIFKIFEENFK